MQFNKIIMNPPYSNGLGGKITTATKELSEVIICLMPLSNYKNKSAELWRHVESFELADPKLFVDADITKNLCICTLENKNVDKYSWEDMQFESFDKRYIEFYKRNKELTVKYHFKEIRFKRCDNATAEEFDKDLDFLESNRLPCQSQSQKQHGYGVGDNIGYRWNIEHNISNIPSGLCVVHFNSNTARDNFSIWAYSSRTKDNLSNDLIFGLGFDTVSDTCSIAIPQIDWETISDNPLWKKGDYDGAVLDVMGLMWDEGKNNIVRE